MGRMSLDEITRRIFLRKYYSLGFVSCCNPNCGRSVVFELSGQKLKAELDIHHIKGKKAHSELRHVQKNLVLLCRTCHDRQHLTKFMTMEDMLAGRKKLDDMLDMREKD